MHTDSEPSKWWIHLVLAQTALCARLVQTTRGATYRETPQLLGGAIYTRRLQPGSKAAREKKSRKWVVAQMKCRAIEMSRN